MITTFKFSFIRDVFVWQLNGLSHMNIPVSLASNSISLNALYARSARFFLRFISKIFLDLEMTKVNCSCRGRCLYLDFFIKLFFALWSYNKKNLVYESLDTTRLKRMTRLSFSCRFFGFREIYLGRFFVRSCERKWFCCPKISFFSNCSQIGLSENECCKSVCYRKIYQNSTWNNYHPNVNLLCKS